MDEKNLYELLKNYDMKVEKNQYNNDIYNNDIYNNDIYYTNYISNFDEIK